MKKIILSTVVFSSVLMAGGYKIPESSTSAVALGAANVAHNKSADAAYYNPANMVYMSDNNEMEVDVTYIGLSKLNYTGDVISRKADGSVLATQSADTDSKKESFIVPSIFYVSPKIGDVRFGMSIVAPAGLSKRWGEQPAKGKAKEFTLEVIELNPTVAMPINEQLSVAFGLRLVHTSGVVKAESAGMYSQDLTGDSIDFGYNLALSYKPTTDTSVGLTYRSNIDLTVEGDADVYASTGFLTAMGIPTAYAIDPKTNVDASVTVPLPAALSLAFAYTLPTKTTLEFVYERTFWSSYENLDFDFKDARAEGIFGGATSKDWNDVNAYRLGVTQEMDVMTLMCGIVIDESPIPEETLGFELPDSDSISLSVGARYEIDKQLSLAFAGLYSMREDTKVNNTSLSGEFTNSNVTIISVGAGYKF